MDQRFAVGAVYVAALFINIMDVTIVNVALPSMGRSFGVSPSHVDVVVISYLVSLSVFIPASGWIGDRFGGKRTLMLAILVFTAASALCGIAGDLSELVVFRVLQGVGGGMLTPIGLAMLYRTFPPSERIRVASILMIPTAMAPALGPVLGGLLVTDLSWRWVFYVNLPIGLAALAFGLVFVEERREPKPGRFDIVGFALSGLGLGSVMYGVTEGPVRGWGSTEVLATLVVGTILMCAMVLTELRTESPMVDVRLFADRLFRVANVLVLVTMTGFFGILYLVPLYYQDGRGLSAFTSGLGTFPEALGVMVGAQVVSRRLYSVVGPRRLVTVGLIGVAACSVLLGMCGAHTNLWWIRVVMFGLGYAIPHAMMCLQTAAFSTISSEATGRASTLFNADRQLGGAVGVALLTSVLSAVGPVRKEAGRLVPHLAAYHAAFFTAAGAAVAGSVLAFFSIKDSDAMATMTRR
jgi:EmrB/QacA subfamily drug resistance transporter